MSETKFFIGTAGWSYKDWKPAFYPFSQSTKFDWMKYYSHYFNCVEVNSTYYAYLSSDIIKGWVQKVEEVDDFMFTVKLHQDFTHKRKFSVGNIKDVKENLNILTKAERFGGLLLQFPYSFAFSDLTVQYLQKLLDTFSEYVRFVEVRHSSWMKPEPLNFFKENDVTFCTIDQPEIGKAIIFEPVITNQKAYIRLHGRNTDAWMNSINNFGKEQTYEQQSQRYDYLYSKGELAEISEKLKKIAEKVKEVFVILNNHPFGKAVVNAFELMEMLDVKSKIVVPDSIRVHFPERIKSLLN